MRRLNAKGRGIILMHDIHAATALALPALLKALKAEGYHVVHVVAAGERPPLLQIAATTTENEARPRVLRAHAETPDAAKLAQRNPVHYHTMRHRKETKINYRSSFAIDQLAPFLLLMPIAAPADAINASRQSRHRGVR